MRLLGTLSAEEIGCGFGEDEADGEVRVMRESTEDIGDLDGCHRTAGC